MLKKTLKLVILEHILALVPFLTFDSQTLEERHCDKYLIFVYLHMHIFPTLSKDTFKKEGKLHCKKSLFRKSILFSLVNCNSQNPNSHFTEP